LYHVVSRGNNQQDIFFGNRDYFRFLQDLFEFNDEDSIVSTYRSILTNPSGSDPDGLEVMVPERRNKHNRSKKRKMLVEILAFCLMPNHFHLLLRQVRDKGISLFMKKVKGGYAAYVNKKYERSGSLFQSHFKAVDIENDYQLNTIFSYIHTNPCQLVAPEWKTMGLKNEKMALGKLNSYRWSSYFDYIGRKNFPSLTNRELFTELYGGGKGCERAVKDWIRHKSDCYEDIKQWILE